MSMQPPPQQGYSGPPSSMEQPAHGGETTGARPAGPQSNTKSMPLGFTAGGGLLVGIVAGLLLISGGGDAPKAEAKGPVVAKAPTTYGDLVEEETPPTPTEGANAGDPVVPKPLADPSGEASETKTEADKPVVIPEPPKPDPTPVEPEPTSVQLQFDITGLEEGVEATITLDNDVVPGTSTGFTIPAGKQKQRAKVVVRAKGYRAFRKTLNVTADMTVAVEMRKKPSGGSGGKKPGGTGPGGLLDL